jgi:hypothetical protein
LQQLINFSHLFPIAMLDLVCCPVHDPSLCVSHVSELSHGGETDIFIHFPSTAHAIQALVQCGGQYIGGSKLRLTFAANNTSPVPQSEQPYPSMPMPLSGAIPLTHTVTSVPLNNTISEPGSAFTQRCTSSTLLSSDAPLFTPRRTHSEP